MCYTARVKPTTARRSPRKDTDSISDRPLEPRLCVRCQARLARDNRSRVCTCHRRTYDPRTDNAWPAKLRSYLTECVGDVAYPAAHFGIVDKARYVVRRSIAVLQREGWDIVVTPQSGAYRVIAARCPVDCATVDADEMSNGERPT